MSVELTRSIHAQASPDEFPHDLTHNVEGGRRSLLKRARERLTIHSKLRRAAGALAVAGALVGCTSGSPSKTNSEYGPRTESQLGAIIGPSMRTIARGYDSLTRTHANIPQLKVSGSIAMVEARTTNYESGHAEPEQLILIVKADPKPDLSKPLYINMISWCNRDACNAEGDSGPALDQYQMVAPGGEHNEEDLLFERLNKLGPWGGWSAYEGYYPPDRALNEGLLDLDTSNGVDSYQNSISMFEGPPQPTARHIASDFLHNFDVFRQNLVSMSK
ncbi:MAG TPA: hypothetical protein VH234_01215 [Candidatus Saccharimonadales bacterium]|jgi:hypothetical protein|nr:hypothetical protein [Candidatus Saccharimonadales bacterium]